MKNDSESRSDRRYTTEQLTASDGRTWTPQEVELMAQWWLVKDGSQEMYDVEAVMSKCGGFESWIDLPDPPAVDLEVERQERERRATP